jgi:hypothetical protein
MNALNQPDVMKQQTNLLFAMSALTALVLLTASQPAGAAGTDSKTLAVKARTATPAAPVAPAPIEVEIPQSLFVVPKKVEQGKDPFFPKSSRVYGVDPSTRSNPAPRIVANLVLKGISGTVERPLAIINTTTFTTGEINEVILEKGRINVQCLEINMVAGTVLLQVGGERRQLYLSR